MPPGELPTRDELVLEEEPRAGWSWAAKERKRGVAGRLGQSRFSPRCNRQGRRQQRGRENAIQKAHSGLELHTVQHPQGPKAWPGFSSSHYGARAHLESRYHTFTESTVGRRRSICKIMASSNLLIQQGVKW